MRITLPARYLGKMKKFRVDKGFQMTANCGEVRLGSLTLKGGSLEVKPGGGASPGSETTSSENGVTGEIFRTPMYCLHTQTGSIPHITPEVLRFIYPTDIGQGVCSQIPPLQISLDSTLKFAESLKKFGKGVGKFVGLPELPIFLTVHDPLSRLKSGHNDKFGIALWSRHGRTSLTPQQFGDVMSNYKTSLGQIISDYDVRAETSGLKRVRKSLSRAEEYTSTILQGKAGNYDQVGLFITIEAAWFDVDEGLARKTVANLLESQHQIEGVVIAGLTDRFGRSKMKTNVQEKSVEDTETASESLNTELLEKVLTSLPSGLPKYIPGPFQLAQFVDLISRGIDIFDSSVVSGMADKAEVFLLDGLETLLPSISKSDPVKHLSESLPARLSNVEEKSSKTNETVVVSMKHKRFFDDFGPISGHCNCYTCRKHTRSYIHHLYATDELLGPVLIQIHNLTALDRFFRILRGIIEENDTVDPLQKTFEQVKKLLNTSVSKDQPEPVEIDDKSALHNLREVECSK